MLPIVVLKFGSSVLASHYDLPTVVDEIYRHLQEGKRVLAVVSAFAGETDRLFARAAATLGNEANPHDVATYVARGEWQSAVELFGELVHAGMAACLVGPLEIGLRVEGEALEADPVSVNAGRLRFLWEKHTTLVLPGYIGVDREDRVCLLGRGGSDLSAIFLAGALGAQCHLVKDVPGVFDQDPALDPAHARRYALIPWHDAAEVAGPLIQPKALSYAERHRIPFSVSRANGALETQVSDVPRAEWGPSAESPVRLRVVLLGHGTVGGGVYQRLMADPDRFDVLAVVTRGPGKAVAAGVSMPMATADINQALRRDVDLIIECLGGIEPAGSIIKTALERGKRVVSANKAVMAEYGAEFAPLMNEPDRQLWCSAAVGGAVPILETLTRLRPRVRAVRGVVSGTCNVVLDALAGGAYMSDAVGAAQRNGLAEANPDRDLSGADSADKLSLIAQVAFGVHVAPQAIPIRGVAAALGSHRMGVWRLVAMAVRTSEGVRLSVAPERVARTTFLGQTTGAENRVEILLEDGEVVRLAGQGAGRGPTTTAMMGDVYEVARRFTRPASAE
jgi:homoserine dehydrogenase